jgi:hypothetical protein
MQEKDVERVADISKAVSSSPEESKDFELMMSSEAVAAEEHRLKINKDQLMPGDPMESFSWFKSIQGMAHGDIQRMLHLLVKGIVPVAKIPGLAKAAIAKQTVKNMITFFAGCNTWDECETLEPFLMSEQFTRRWVFMFRGRGGSGKYLLEHAAELESHVFAIRMERDQKVKAHMRANAGSTIMSAAAAIRTTDYHIVGSGLPPLIHVMKCDVYKMYDTIKNHNVDFKKLGMMIFRCCFTHCVCCVFFSTQPSSFRILRTVSLTSKVGSISGSSPSNGTRYSSR